MKSIVFLLLIRKLTCAILMNVHFREKRGIIVIIKKANFYSDILRIEFYSEAYNVFCLQTLVDL